VLSRNLVQKKRKEKEKKKINFNLKLQLEFFKEGIKEQMIFLLMTF